MTQQGGSWLDRFEKFGDKVANEVANVGRQAKADLDRRQAEQSLHQAQSAAERQFQDQRRWERAQSPTWTTPVQPVDTTEWATFELQDPRSGMDAVNLRHPATWNVGGAVTWVPEPGIPARYAIGSSPADGACVAERFGRLDFVSGPFVSDGGGRFAVPAVSPEELIALHVVPRLRGARANLLVVQVQRVDPGLYTSQPLRRELSPEGYLAWVEYDRDGVRWADEMLVLRYSFGDSGPAQPHFHGCSVWSMAAPRDRFPEYRGTLRAVALSCTTRPGWDGYVAETTRSVVLP